MIVITKKNGDMKAYRALRDIHKQVIKRKAKQKTKRILPTFSRHEEPQIADSYIEL